jgi:hypothetical protein
MKLIEGYFCSFTEERKKAETAAHWQLLGIEALAQIERKPFVWPKKNSKTVAADERCMPSSGEDINQPSPVRVVQSITHLFSEQNKR